MGHGASVMGEASGQMLSVYLDYYKRLMIVFNIYSYCQVLKVLFNRT